MSALFTLAVDINLQSQSGQCFVLSWLPNRLPPVDYFPNIFLPGPYFNPLAISFLVRSHPRQFLEEILWPASTVESTLIACVVWFSVVSFSELGWYFDINL